jgi:UDP-N-acetyl-alpha-D-muramoyl-L-alanyl-L-glutamate epimerase
VQELRREYPEFRYDRFQVDYSGSCVRIQFDFVLSPELEFHPALVISSSHSMPRRLPPGVLENLVFHLGLIESLSYWKAACSPKIEVRAGFLETEQVAWWINLLLNGMGEYFYVNNIDFTEPNFIQLESTGPRRPRLDQIPSSRILLPIGGGRDSGVTGMTFANSGLPIGCLLLNPTPAAKSVVQRLRPTETITINRTIDPQLLALNNAGFLNGHTPFSAYLAFLSVVCAALFDYRDIAFANEHSSNQGNVEYLGHVINHQYSKSLRFEEDFDRYLQRYLIPGVRYFSFVRPLCELQIGRAFTRFRELFGVIKSCNRNVNSQNWCGDCPKCLSVFVTTYPFAKYEDVLAIFGRDFFEGPNTIQLMNELAGLGEHKPFECVCAYEEFVAGLQLSIDACKKAGRELPMALAYAETEILQAVRIPVDSAVLLEDSAPHRVPAEFQPLLKSLC